MKKALTFILVFLPWLLSGFLFSSDFSYYDTLNLPFFALPKGLFFPAWILLYILISISITMLIHQNYIKYEQNYKMSLLYNYIFNQLFLFLTFTLKNLFLGFIDAVLIFITSLFFYYETKELNKKAARVLLPYIYFSLYAVILMLFVYFMNL